MLEAALIMASAVAGIFKSISERGSREWLRGLAGVLAGISLATTTALQPMATIFAGMLLGVAIAGVEGLGRRLTVATFFLIYAMQPKEIYAACLIIAVVCSYIDEMWAGRKGILGKGVLLPLAAVVMGWATAAAVIAYRLGEKITGATCRGMRGS